MSHERTLQNCAQLLAATLRYTNMNTQEFCTAHNIMAIVAYADSNPSMASDEWARDANHYRVTLRYGKRRMTVPFSMGSAIGHEPTAADVLDCLASDTSGVDNARDFADWASEYGFDADSRKAERTFKTCERQAKKLRAFLGESYEELMDADRS